ncbi:MAG: hypothetical protein U5M51_10240 [Emticicia sp.]|nr:hypothetical protein [Emticicia sp.]
MKKLQIYLLYFVPLISFGQEHSIEKHQKGTSLEAFGLSPFGSLNFDYVVHRTQQGFFNLQIGVGIMSTIEDKWSFPHAISYNYLLNKSAKRKDQCKPNPKNRNETFLEIGYGQIIHSNQSNWRKIEYAMPIIGFRTHFTKKANRELYFKFRFTPNLLKNHPTFAGLALGKVI